MFKKQIFLVFFLLLAAISNAANIVDVYDFKMSLKIPRVYDNTGSLGYRKYQSQSISGQLYVTYIENQLPKVSVSNLVNQTHKLSTGQKVSYECYDNEEFSQNFVYIGSNKTQKFTTPSISFAFIADPSYNIGSIDGDNSLYLFLSGSGSSGYKKAYSSQVAYSLSGYAIGQIGCGCSEYTHISPTRVAWYYGPSTIITDISSVRGTWSAKLKQRKSLK